MIFNFLIVNKYEILRKGLEAIVKQNFPKSTTILSDNFDDIIDSTTILKIDIAIIDISYDEISKFSTLEKLKVLNPKIKLLVFSNINDENYNVRCFKNGPNGIININCNEEYISQTIQYLLNGNKFFLKDIKMKLIGKTKFNKHKLSYNDLHYLSEREFELASMFILGYSNSKISEKLQIAKSTVSTYKRRIFLKTNTNNIIQLSQVFKRKPGEI